MASTDIESNVQIRLGFAVLWCGRQTFAWILSVSFVIVSLSRPLSIKQTHAEILISNLVYRSLYNNLKLSYYFAAKTCFALVGDNMMLRYLSFYYSTFSPLMSYSIQNSHSAQQFEYS